MLIYLSEVSHKSGNNNFANCAEFWVEKKKKGAFTNPPAFILPTEGMYVLSHCKQKNPHCEEKNAWNLNSVSKICSGPGTGKLLVLHKCIGKGENRI